MLLALALLAFLIGYVVGRLRGPFDCQCNDDTDNLRVEANLLAFRLSKVTNKLVAAIRAAL